MKQFFEEELNALIPYDDLKRDVEDLLDILKGPRDMVEADRVSEFQRERIQVVGGWAVERAERIIERGIERVEGSRTGPPTSSSTPEQDEAVLRNLVVYLIRRVNVAGGSFVTRTTTGSSTLPPTAIPSFISLVTSILEFVAGPLGDLLVTASERESASCGGSAPSRGTAPLRRKPATNPVKDQAKLLIQTLSYKLALFFGSPVIKSRSSSSFSAGHGRSGTTTTVVNASGVVGVSTGTTNPESSQDHWRATIKLLHLTAKKITQDLAEVGNVWTAFSQLPGLNFGAREAAKAVAEEIRRARVAPLQVVPGGPALVLSAPARASPARRFAPGSRAGDRGHEDFLVSDDQIRFDHLQLAA